MARWRSEKIRRARSSRSSARRPGPADSGAGRGPAPCLVGKRLVQRFCGRGPILREDAVDVPLVQRPVEDAPVAAVQQEDRLPERLQEACVVKAVEQLPIVRMDRVVDDFSGETEVAHDCARLGQRLGGRPPEAFLDGPRELSDRDHASSTTSGLFWAPEALIGLPQRAPNAYRGPRFPRGAARLRTFRLSRLNFAEHPLRHSERVRRARIAMKRKSGKSIVDLDKKPAIVHFKIGSGYLSYLEQDVPGQTPRVKSVVISKEAW